MGSAASLFSSRTMPALAAVFDRAASAFSSALGLGFVVAACATTGADKVNAVSSAPDRAPDSAMRFGEAPLGEYWHEISLLRRIDISRA